MRRTLALLAVPAVLLAACGGDEPKAPTPESQVRSTLTRFADAVQGKDYDTLCSRVFAPSLVSGLEEVGLTCPKAMQQAFGQVDSPQLSVDAVDVTGEKATARVRTSAVGQATSTDTVQLVRQGGDWRISALGSSSGSTPGS